MKQRKAGIGLAVRSSVRRCAIYTRKSSEEGLEQAFNSLDAQREACEAYILSQRHEGWIAVPTLYDDGGISGGTMERPALQQLLADITARKVDMVVVYKVDRLTRSLSDFAKIVDVFDANGTSFVSVTQQFNTTTSMGRLTLNMLLSFAQFEREVTGERIRDKIAASKRKGMWMGGNVPLGYEVQDRKLVINPAAAETVRHIFRAYLELGSVRKLQEHLAEAGILSRRRPSAKAATPRGGVSFGRGALYTMLQNQVYRGQVHHQGNTYQGEHEAIIEPAVWDAAQAQLERNRHERQSGQRAANPSLLAGLIFDQDGERLIPTHATKKGRRYRYYISKTLNSGQAANAPNGLRIPAGDLERLVSDRLLQFLTDRPGLLGAVRAHLPDGNDQKHLLARAEHAAAAWQRQPVWDRRVLLRQIVAGISVSADTVSIEISADGLTAAFGPNTGEPKQAALSSDPVVLTLPVQLRRSKFEMKLLVRGSHDHAKPDPTLIKLIVKAHRLRDALLEGGLMIGELAEREGLTSSYVTRVIRLAYLAPDIVAAILNGQQPADLTATMLLMDSRLPLAWDKQKQALGFDGCDAGVRAA